MNKNLALFFLGTKIQNFAAALYSFGFIIIFYQLTHSLIYCSTLSAFTIVCSRGAALYFVPKFKKRDPIKISVIMNISMGITALAAIIPYSLWNKSIYFYFVLAVILAVLEEIDNSFQYPVIPRIVEGEYLFKANSLNAIFSNINMIVSPLGSYLFYRYSDFKILLLVFGIVCIISSWIVGKVKMKGYSMEYDNKESVISSWKNTLKIITGNRNIAFCISIGLVVNLIFSGLFGPVMLEMGAAMPNQAFGQSLLKVVISAGSLMGVFGVYKLNVKSNYKKYINISILSLAVTLILLTFSNHLLTVYSGFLVMAVLIMFIMNSTGTFLQMSAPKGELPAIYAFRSTLIAGVVPLSQITAGIIVQLFSANFYFLFSSLLVITIYMVKRYKIDVSREKWSFSSDGY